MVFESFTSSTYQHGPDHYICRPNATLLSTMKFFKLNDDDDNGTVGDGDDNNTNVDMNNNKDVADTVYKTKS